MTRAQCILHRGNQILMVKHRLDGEEWWCLPGGGVMPSETPAQAVLRELEEECHVHGRIVRQTGYAMDIDHTETITYLVDIDCQDPKMGSDPEFTADHQILVDMQWLRLAEIPERDRAYLFSAGLMNIPAFLEEVSRWGDSLSYPLE